MIEYEKNHELGELARHVGLDIRQVCDVVAVQIVLELEISVHLNDEEQQVVDEVEPVQQVEELKLPPPVLSQES